MLKGFKYTYKVMEKKGYSSSTEYPQKPRIFWVKNKNGDYVWSEDTHKAYKQYMDDLFAREKERKSIVEKTKSGFSRSCLEEKETNQFIGRAKSCLKKKEYSVEEWKKLFELKSCEKRKYFKY